MKVKVLIKMVEDTTPVVDEVQVKRNIEIERLNNLAVKVESLQNDAEDNSVDTIMPDFYVQFVSDLDSLARTISERRSELNS